MASESICDKPLADQIVANPPYPADAPGIYIPAAEMNTLRAHLIELRGLIDELSYDDACTPGYHPHWCEAHSWEPTEPGQRCPDARAQELLARWGEVDGG